MKNTQIHNGLEKKEIRDFLATSLNSAYLQIPKPVIPYISNDKNPFEHQVKELENDIDYLQKQLLHAKQNSAICQIMIMNGWEEFDVDEETQNDTGTGMSINFIGTEAEYYNLMKQIEKEQQ